MGAGRKLRMGSVKTSPFVIPKAVLWPEESVFAWSLNKRGLGVAA